MHNVFALFDSGIRKGMSEEEWAKTVTNLYQDNQIKTEADFERYKLDKNKQADFDNYIANLKEKKIKWEPIKTAAKGKKKDKKKTATKTKVKKEKKTQKKK